MKIFDSFIAVVSPDLWRRFVCLHFNKEMINVKHSIGLQKN